jgi:hypothetical protein
MNNRIWQARILIQNDKLDEEVARRIASKILHEKYGKTDGMMFTILGVSEKDGIPIFLQVYRIKAAKTKESAGAMGRWGKPIPFIEFKPEITSNK